MDNSTNPEKILNKNSKKEVKEEIININIKPVNNKIFKEDKKKFIQEKIKLAKKNFENEINHKKDWRKYLDKETNSNDSETTFFKTRLIDEI